jgi:type IV pilus assembly protein PilM
MSNMFQNIFGDGFSSMFGSKKEESVLGIDIGSSSIKIVQLKKKGGKAVLETYGALALGPYAQTDVGTATNLPAEALTQALLDVLKESNTTTKNGALAIPSSASLIFLITLPGAISESDLSAIIPNEARKYIPVPISEVTLDWWMIPREAESVDEGNENAEIIRDAKTEVLTVAIHNDTLAKYRELLNVSGINSNFFEMEVFSSVRSAFGHELAPVLMIDFGASKTKLSIIEHGIVRTFHVIPRGGQDITKSIATSMNAPFKQAEQIKRDVGLDANQNPTVASVVAVSVDYIFNETNSIVLAYEKKYNKAISKVIFTGGGALLRGLLERGMTVFSAEVVYADPFGKTEAPAFLAPILETSGPEFTVAVGLALRQLS